MAAIFLVISLLVSMAAGINYFLSIGTATGAPQQAAGAAMALATAAIPYMIARAVSDISLHHKLDQLREGRGAPTGQTSTSPATFDWGFLGYIVLGLILAMIVGIWISKGS